MVSRQGQTLKSSCGSTGTSALESCLQPPEYLCAATGGPLRVKLPEGISLTSFFILHPQSWNGCHRTNNPRFHLNIGVGMKPSPRATLPLCTQGMVKSHLFGSQLVSVHSSRWMQAAQGCLSGSKTPTPTVCVVMLQNRNAQWNSGINDP